MDKILFRLFDILDKEPEKVINFLTENKDEITALSKDQNKLLKAVDNIEKKLSITKDDSNQSIEETTDNIIEEQEKENDG